MRYQNRPDLNSFRCALETPEIGSSIFLDPPETAGDLRSSDTLSTSGELCANSRASTTRSEHRASQNKSVRTPEVAPPFRLAGKMTRVDFGGNAAREPKLKGVDMKVSTQHAGVRAPQKKSPKTSFSAAGNRFHRPSPTAPGRVPRFCYTITVSQLLRSKVAALSPASPQEPRKKPSWTAATSYKASR